jgi:hypothetical protein
MARNLLPKLTLKAVVFLASGGILVACGGPQDVRFDAIVLLSGGNLIKNGSFEDGAERFVNTTDEPINAGAKLICGNSTTLPNWSVTRLGSQHQDCAPPTPPTNGAFDAVNWFDSSNPAKVNAKDGRKFIDLTGFNHRPPSGYGSIQQVIQTSPGADYVLFSSVGSTTANPSNLRVGIQVDAADSGTPDTPLKSLCGAITDPGGTQPGSGCRFYAEIPPTSVSDWQPKTMQFTAIGGETIIRFTGVGDDPGSDYVGLDKVELYCAGRKLPGFFYLVGC